MQWRPRRRSSRRRGEAPRPVSGRSPLGKTILAAIAYFGTLAVLGFLWRGKSFALRSILIVAGVLVLLGILFTFPPIFRAFASD